jgi:hypothetical protein
MKGRRNSHDVAAECHDVGSREPSQNKLGLHIRNDQEQIGIARVDAVDRQRRVGLTAVMRLVIEEMRSRCALSRVSTLRRH